MPDTKEAKDPIIAVGPGADEELPEETRGNQDDAAGDDYQYPEGDDEDSPEREARVGHAEGGEEEEEGQHLTPSASKRRRKRARFERQNRELEFLRARNEQLEREHSRRMAELENRQAQTDVLAIDGRIAETEKNLREAESLHQQAIDTNNGAAASEALRVRDTFREGLNQLKGARQRTVQQARERQRAPAATPPPNPRAQAWVAENPWFNPQNPNEDTLIAQAVENRLYREGRLDQGTEAYWQELDRRLAHRLPEHYSRRSERRPDDEDDLDDEDDRPARNGSRRTTEAPRRRASGPTFKVGGRERPLNKGEVYIDADRKAAMIEKGVWDDPVLRERQLKYYQQYDRDAGRRPR